MTDTPDTPPPAPAPAPAGPVAPNIIRFPFLISAICNGLVALMWILTCFLFFLAIPLIVLAVFEILYFVKLGQPDYARHKPKLKIMSILEICAIILGSVGSLVCGIIVLLNLDKEIPDDAAATA